MPDAPPRFAGHPRRTAVLRWTLAVLVGALLPKCVLCLAGYVVLFTGAGVTVTELCGGGTLSTWVLIPAGLVAAWVAMAAIWFLTRFFSRPKTDVRNETTRSLNH